MPKSTVAESGQALLELILAVALIGLFLTTFVLGIIYVREGYNHAKVQNQARLYLEQELEALRIVKETSWNSFASPGIYHITQVGNSWSVLAGVQTDNNISHSFTVANVCRTAALALPSDCSSPGAIIDPSTKKIVALASWSLFGSQSLSQTTYLTRNFNNQVLPQTTAADFNLGTNTATAVTNSAGGEVQLAAASGGNWNAPTVVATRKLGGNAQANGVYVTNNQAYLVTNSQSGADFFIYDVTTPTNPSLLGSLDLGGDGNKVFVLGNYAYVATTVNSQEMKIINVSNPAAPILAGSFNTATNADARSVFVVGQTAYLVTNNNTTGVGYELYSINVTNPAAPTLLGGLNLGSSARDLFISGNYAYIASTNTAQELQIANITNPASPILAGTYNAIGNNQGTSIYAIGTTIYLNTNQLNILNATNPTSVTPVGSYSFSGTPQGIFVAGTLAFLANTQVNSEFKSVNITNPATPSLYGSVSLGAGATGVFVVGDYAYLATSNSNSQFQIVRGGSGLAYQNNGTFESNSLTTGQNAGFNYLNFTSNKPAGTTLRLQIATNSDNSTWNFVGPDGTSASFFNNSSEINLNNVSETYLRYRAYFTSSGSVTPTLFDVTVNYSP